MERILMNLRGLRTFVATADSGGLGRACARLNVSQPAASRQIHALEAEFGVPLFHRVGRQLRLTSAGEGLLRHSRRLLADADELSEQAQALKSGRRATLKVSATPQLTASFLTPFLPRHRQRHSGIDVQLIEGSAARYSNQFERGETDLALMPPSDTRYPGRLLFPLHVFAVVRKAHRLGRRAAVDIAELADESLLLLPTTFGTRACFDAACEIAQVVPRLRFECTAAHTLIGLAAVDYGVAVIPSIALALDESLRALPILLRGASIGHWMAVCWDPRRLMSAYVETFVNELVVYAPNAFPGRKFVRRAPPLPKPAGPFR
jgi:DNA-binding transcriptional LysR family regulator